MTKKTKTSIIMTSLGAIALAGSVMAGATYALFTSESNVNIAVSSGKVDVNASIEGLTAYTPKAITTDGVISDETDIADNSEDTKKFGNGGTVSLSGDTLTLDKLTPGDKVNFSIRLSNDSSVKALYRIKLGCVEDNGLFAGLKVDLVDADDIEFAQSVPGITSISKYASLDPLSEDNVIKLSIELPADAGNDYQTKSCSISCNVEAVQGNANVSDADEHTLQLFSATDLVSYGVLESACVDSTSTLYNYSFIELMNDVDMDGIKWVSIKGRSHTLNGITFEGNGHTIKNLYTTEIEIETNYYSGFFGRISNSIIQNLNIDHAVVNSTHYAGGIVGQLCYDTQVKNCKVTNSTITSTAENYKGSWDNGDKVGGIAGHFEGYTNAQITNCVVEDCTLTGYRDIGGILGCGYMTFVISNNTVKNVTLTSDKTHDYKNYETADEYNVHEILGRIAENEGNNVTVKDNTFSNVTINNTK